MNHLEKEIDARYGENTAAYRKHYSGKGRIWTGILLLLIGAGALLKGALTPALPSWLFSWQMLLILLGLFFGVRHNFRGGIWFVLILIGTIFLISEYQMIRINGRYIWPAALIIMGAFLIFKPRRKDWRWQEKQPVDDNGEVTTPSQNTYAAKEDMLDSTSVFGGIKKSILSKNFKGGDIVNILGGAEINLSQADIQGTVELEVTQIFGGTMLIVPPHWDVKPEMAAIFGGIDDKRPVHNVSVDPTKKLILKGTSIFGGIEIKSY